jgi:Glyoxalase superfamily protein
MHDANATLDPILRISDEAKTREFYVGFLGFVNAELTIRLGAG